MRQYFAALAVAALALAGCSSGDEEAAPSTAPATSETEQSSGPTELAIGEAAHLTTDGENKRDIDVTITDIQVFEQCPEGELESMPSGKEGGVYVLVKWDTDVRESVHNYAATNWVGVGEGGSVLETNTAGECRQPEGVKYPGYVLPGTNASEGQVFWASEKPENWFLNEPWEPHAFAWPVPGEIAAGNSPEAPELEESSASEVPEASAAPAAESGPTVVGCANHGGTARMSDGSEAYSASCDENAGGLVPGNSAPGGDYAGPFEPATTVAPEYSGNNLREGWVCDGPAYMCRDDAASGKAEGQGGY